MNMGMRRLLYPFNVREDAKFVHGGILKILLHRFSYAPLHHSMDSSYSGELNKENNLMISPLQSSLFSGNISGEIDSSC